jgi:hypothetical protein
MNILYSTPRGRGFWCNGDYYTRAEAITEIRRIMKVKNSFGNGAQRKMRLLRIGLYLTQRNKRNEV